MFDLQGKIGAPGFEPGTSPTRIMGEIWVVCEKSLEIAMVGVGLYLLSDSRILAADSRGLGSEIELLPNRFAGSTSVR